MRSKNPRLHIRNLSRRNFSGIGYELLRISEKLARIRAFSLRLNNIPFRPLRDETILWWRSLDGEREYTMFGTAHSCAKLWERLYWNTERMRTDGCEAALLRQPDGSFQGMQVKGTALFDVLGNQGFIKPGWSNAKFIWKDLVDTKSVFNDVRYFRYSATVAKGKFNSDCTHVFRLVLHEHGYPIFKHTTFTDPHEGLKHYHSVRNRMARGEYYPAGIHVSIEKRDDISASYSFDLLPSQ